MPMTWDGFVFVLLLLEKSDLPVTWDGFNCVLLLLEPRHDGL